MEAWEAVLVRACDDQKFVLHANGFIGRCVRFYRPGEYVSPQGVPLPVHVLELEREGVSSTFVIKDGHEVDVLTSDETSYLRTIGDLFLAACGAYAKKSGMGAARAKKLLLASLKKITGDAP